MRYVRLNHRVFVSALPIGAKLEAAKAICEYEPYSPKWLNSLPDEEKQAVAAGEFTRRLHDSGGAHVTWIFWRGRHRIIGAPPISHGGSAFLLDCGRGPFVVTAAHVFSQFVIDKQRAQRLGSQLGNVAFDLEERLIDSGYERRIDIATFRIAPNEIADLAKCVVVGAEGAWPAPPKEGEIVFFGGFLGSQRIAISPNEVSFGLHLGMTPVSDFTEHQIRCRFERKNWVDVRGLGLPLPGYDLGGVGGGPLLVPVYSNKQWSWRLAGVISEAQMLKEYEVLTAVRAHFILPDGRIG
jgi:hypothetical protein